MKLSLLGPLILTAIVGCGRSPTSPPMSPDRASVNQRPGMVKRINPGKQASVREVRRKPAFDEKEMIRPLNEIEGFSIGNFRVLPNCLDVFSECVAVPYDGKTSAQYKSSVLEVARKPCRIVLKVVDVSADYDLAHFELLTDEGESGAPALERAGYLWEHNERVRPMFPINNVKKKGLDEKRLSIGDRVVLVGLGDVAPASPWGADTPGKQVPRGDDRYVMLRAFGKPDSHNPRTYEFCFMVRNWYIASQ